MTPSDHPVQDATSETRPSTLLFSNHARVLACVARDPEVRMREVAERVGLTERAVLRLVGELEEAGFLQRQREGRCNRYRVSPAPLLQLSRAFEALANAAAAGSVETNPEAPAAPRASSDGISRNLSFID